MFLNISSSKKTETSKYYQGFFIKKQGAISNELRGGATGRSRNAIKLVEFGSSVEPTFPTIKIQIAYFLQNT
ncbi:MAG: hypothetical protein ACJAWV_003383 [Flammeovirgaceae bacterium]